jgi:mannose-6-phosphate isomerase-like protein (cupin superfamily)
MPEGLNRHAPFLLKHGARASSSNQESLYRNSKRMSADGKGDMKMEFSTERQIKLADAQNAIPTREGKLYAELFRHGTLTVEIYAPKGTDMQQPHTRDELYIVAAGRGWFFVEGQRVQFGPGDALFAAAGEVHRFEDFTEDLLTWVVFYGPEGGERA